MIIVLLFLLTWVVFGVQGGMLGGLCIALMVLGAYTALQFIIAMCVGMYVMYKVTKT